MFEGNALWQLIERLRAVFISRNDPLLLLTDDNGDVLSDDNGDVLEEF